MNNPEAPAPARSSVPSLIHNWLSLFGIILAASAFFAVLCLIAMDIFASFSNPYMGILTYIVAPGFLVAGLLLISFGAWRERKRRRKLAPGEIPAHPRIDFNVPQQRRAFITVVVVTFVFLLLTAFGSYQTYHYTESVQFCGQTCHTVMKPEFTAHKNSPHARVTCAECHIGSGADWFVKSKLSGSYQVYAVLADKYPKPIPTPVKNLRPAQDTCEQCHWPQKFFGSAGRVNHHFLSDETNTPWTISMLMKVGGGDATHGEVGGIHWHMNIANKIEYVHTDEARQQIPWVKVTDSNGKETVYQSTETPIKPEELAKATPRRMDCIDCHNRPTHIYQSPVRAVNVAMSTGRLDPSIPFIKKQAVEVLAAEYKSTDEALAAIAEKLTAFYQSKYPDFLKANDAKVRKAVTEVQTIFGNNFFPEMKVNWKAYPDNIGHNTFLGCFRCHDGKHVSADGRKVSSDCSSCHTIIAQGSGAKLESVSAKGLEFQHPGDEVGELWKDMKCTDCHDGGPQK